MPETEPYSVSAAENFAKKYANISSERQYAQSFWRDLFADICGLPDLSAIGVEFERPVRSSTTGRVGFIDVLWPAQLLAEHKSAGKNLDDAEKQARDYLISLETRERPPVIIVSDFQRFRIIEVLAGHTVEFNLSDITEHLHRFRAIVGDAGRAAARVEIQADIKAAQLMAELWSELDDAGYGDEPSAILAVRLLFLMYCDDAGVFQQGQFEDFLRESPESGVGLGAMLAELFDVLNTPKDKRATNLSPQLAAFPYVNGSLFGGDSMRVANFTSGMRAAVIRASEYDWRAVSPSVLGSLYQAARDPKLRAQLGEHYTSPENVLKTLGGLLSDLDERLFAAWDSAQMLRQFLKHLGSIKVADFAAGSGNFLVLSYRKLRDYEVRARARLNTMSSSAEQGAWDFDEVAAVHLGNFYGVEIDHFSSDIARVAMWLTAQQANVAQERVLGTAPDLLPLSESANIITANALTIDWAGVLGVEPGEQTPNVWVVGNPPFIGSSLQTSEQKAELLKVWGKVRGAGDLDYVTAWFLLAARYIHEHGGHAALVSTNSVSQGTHPPVLWGELSRLGMNIDFAHRSFRWSNDAPGVAAVHTVITGFSRGKSGPKKLYDYPDIQGQPVEHSARNINAYLLDAPNVLISARATPLASGTPIMDYGSKPTDSGYLSDISVEEARRIRETDATAAQYLRRVVGARELIHNTERWCLWLVGATPSDIRSSPELSKRVSAVRAMREASTKAKTREDAGRAHEFQEIRQPTQFYIAVPLVSSELREYVPMAYLSPDVVANNLVSVVAGAPLWLFALLNSRVFNVWNKAVSGRLESRVRISNTITYNNFPIPPLSEDWPERLDSAGQAILDARAQYPTSTLADLYENVSMPTELRAAHTANDRLVLRLFGLKPTATDEDILACLFERYASAVDGLLASAPKRAGTRARS
jgi:hypothetical protein